MNGAPLIAHRLSKTLSAAKLAILERSGHMRFIEQPGVRGSSAGLFQRRAEGGGRDSRQVASVESPLEERGVLHVSIGMVARSSCEERPICVERSPFHQLPRALP